MSKEKFFGSADGLSICVSWANVTDKTESSSERTRGWVTLSIGSEVLWGDENSEGIEWTWIELLEYMARQWPEITLSERIDFDEDESNKIDILEFEDGRNLAKGLDGIWLPDIIITKLGTISKVRSTNDKTFSLSWSETIMTLEAFGNEIADRLKPWAHDRRANEAIEDWKNRIDIPKEAAISIYSGMELSYLSDICPDEIVRLNSKDEFEPDCVLAVARYSKGEIIESDLRTLLQAVITHESHAKTPHLILDRISKEAVTLLSKFSDSAPPYEQGYQIAHSVRLKFPNAKNYDSRLDMDLLFENLGIPIYEFHLESKILDAITIWPDGKRICVLINENGLHSSSKKGRNATLAHELCHILIDRTMALPLVDVVGGKVPKELEKRARAFAAELLVSTEVIQVESKNLTVRNVPETLERLSREYLASEELINYHLYNRGDFITDDVKVVLKNFNRIKLSNW